MDFNGNHGNEWDYQGDEINGNKKKKKKGENSGEYHIYGIARRV